MLWKADVPSGSPGVDAGTEEVLSEMCHVSFVRETEPQFESFDSTICDLLRPAATCDLPRNVWKSPCIRRDAGVPLASSRRALNDLPTTCRTGFRIISSYFRIILLLSILSIEKALDF